MESQGIKILLQKYFEAETTLSEENELINYFNSGKVDEELKSYIPMFSGLRETPAFEYPYHADDLMNHIVESDYKERARSRRMWQIVTGIAASVIVIMLAVNFYSNQRPWEDTYSDPEKAYAEAVKTLEYVAGKYNKGVEKLQPLGRIESAAAPFYSGMRQLEKGFEKLEEIESMNLKL